MTTIRIKNLSLRTIIGFNPEERVNRQDIVINILFKADLSEESKADRLNEFVDYKTICKKVIRFVEDSQFYLLEALTQGILDLIMKEPGVHYARVEVDKPHALRFAESVSVELESSK